MPRAINQRLQDSITSLPATVSGAIAEPHPKPRRSCQVIGFHRVTWNLERCQQKVIIWDQIMGPEG